MSGCRSTTAAEIDLKFVQLFLVFKQKHNKVKQISQLEEFEPGRIVPSRISEAGMGLHFENKRGAAALGSNRKGKDRSSGRLGAASLQYEFPDELDLV